MLGQLDSLLIDSLESWLGPRRRRVFASLLRHLQAASPGLRVVAFVAEGAFRPRSRSLHSRSRPR